VALQTLKALNYLKESLKIIHRGIITSLLKLSECYDDRVFDVEPQISKSKEVRLLVRCS